MIASAGEGWRSMYMVNEQDTGAALTRIIAFWAVGPDGAMSGITTDDTGQLAPSESVPGFVCYLAPDDEPLQILKQRALLRRAQLNG